MPSRTPTASARSSCAAVSALSFKRCSLKTRASMLTRYTLPSNPHTLARSRPVFTLRRSELLFFYQNGASHLFPDAWEPYYTHIPEDERDDMISAYYKRLTSEDENVRLEAARRWSTWENMTSKLCQFRVPPATPANRTRKRVAMTEYVDFDFGRHRRGPRRQRRG